jgi:hypothetical protein
MALLVVYDQLEHVLLPHHVGDRSGSLLTHEQLDELHVNDFFRLSLS